MHSSFKTVLASALLASTALVTIAHAAQIPLLTGPGQANPGNFPADFADINSTLNAINSSGATGINPNTMAPFANFRNYLDNGAFNINQRAVTATTAMATSNGCIGKNPVGATNGYSADRWCTIANASSSNAKAFVATATPTPPTGFSNELKITRDSGTLTQQICALQEIQTTDFKNLAGQPVTFSVWMAALAGLNADNGSVVSMNLFTGTGTDEGLASFTAAPALTPAFTGIATQAAINGTTVSKTITTSQVRYNASFTVPSTATEGAVAICFHPAKGTTGSSSDGLAFTGAQLEQGLTPSSFEFHPVAVDLAKAQTRFVRVNDSTLSQQLLGLTGIELTSQQCVGTLAVAENMAGTPLTTNQISASSGGLGVVGTRIASLASGTRVQVSSIATQQGIANGAASLSLTLASANATLAGDTCVLVSGGVPNTNMIDISSDF